jgi:hypothetical protein
MQEVCKGDAGGKRTDPAVLAGLPGLLGCGMSTLAVTMLKWGSAPAPGVVTGALASHLLGSPNGLIGQ